MSDLRVFISSTCYDLGYERSELKRFIESLGFDAVCSDNNDILYNPEEHTHTSCVKKVADCDLFVLIIGGRFGGRAIAEAVDLINPQFLPNGKDAEYSITELEYFFAIQNRIPVFTFVKSDVYADHGKFLKNSKKESKISLNTKIKKMCKRFSIKYPSEEVVYKSIQKPSDAGKIFNFINIVRKKEKNNAIFVFENVDNIEIILKKQWSSFFKNLINRFRNPSIPTSNNDTKTLLQILNNIDMQALINHSNQDVRYMDGEIINVWDPTIEFYYKNPNYMFDDPKLGNYLNDIFVSFYASGPCDLRYNGSNGENPLVWNSKDTEALRSIYQARKNLGKTIGEFLKYLKTNYSEIDILETNKKARINNSQFLH